MKKALPRTFCGAEAVGRKSRHRLPDVLAEIASVIGEPAALAIARAKGGARAHFPGRSRDGHWLTETVGRDAAEKLCKHFAVGKGGVHLIVPLGPTNLYGQAKERAIAMRAEGVSISETARTLGVSTRSVEKWTAAAKALRDPPLLKPNGRP